MAAFPSTRFDFVFSIGASCACATYLRRYGLRECAAPFDWLIGAPFGTYIALLKNGFSGFLQKADLVALEQKHSGGPANGNDHYKDAATGFCLYHDFRHGQTFDAQYAEVKGKYDRRVARLLERLNAPGNVLMVWWTRAEDMLSADELQAALQALAQRYPRPTLHFLICENDLARKDLKYEQVAAQIVRVTGPLAPANTGTTGDEQINAGIFRAIRTTGKARDKYRARLLRLLVHVCSSIFPSKNRRVKARRFLEHVFGIEN